jgi:hypothetical protein
MGFQPRIFEVIPRKLSLQSMSGYWQVQEAFRHLAVYWPPGIFPLYFQDSPDGLPFLSAVYLEPLINALSLTPAHIEADPDRAELLTRCAVLVGAETLCESCRPLALPNGRMALSPSSVPPRWLRLVPRIALTVIARADPR